MSLPLPNLFEKNPHPPANEDPSPLTPTTTNDSDADADSDSDYNSPAKKRDRLYRNLTYTILFLFSIGYIHSQIPASSRTKAPPPVKDQTSGSGNGPEWLKGFKYHQQGAYQGVDWFECDHPLVNVREENVRDRFSCAEIR